MKKRILALILVLVMAVTAIHSNAPAPVYAAAESDSTDVELSSASKDYTMSGSGSIGDLIARTVNADQNQLNVGNAAEYGITDVILEKSGSSVSAKVYFTAKTKATLLIACFSEEGDAVVGGGSVEITSKDREATVKISSENLPEYFIVRAYLLDRKTRAYLCNPYENLNYTESVQAFLKESISDIVAEGVDESRIFNLDESETNNFMVFNENVKMFREEYYMNHLSIEDEEHGKYTFDIPTLELMEVQPGDIVVYEKNDGNQLVIAVTAIDTSGGRVVLTSGKAELEDVFSYVKINDTGALDNTVEDTLNVSSKADELRTLAYANSRRNIYRGSDVEFCFLPIIIPNVPVNDLGTITIPVKFPFWGDFELEERKPKAEKEVSIEGTIKLTPTFNLTLYMVKTGPVVTYLYISVLGDVTMEIEDFKINIEGSLEFPLPELPIPILGGVVKFAVSPSLIVKGNAYLNYSATLKKVFGFEYNKLFGVMVDKSRELEVLGSELSTNVDLFIGSEITVSISLLDERLLSAGITTDIGVKAEASMTNVQTGYTLDEKHDCGSQCIRGEVFSCVEMEAYVDLATVRLASLEIPGDEPRNKFEGMLKKHLFDFYYSLKYNQGGKTKCPFTQKKVSIFVIANDPLAQKNCKFEGLKSDYTYNGSELVTYLPAGTHTIKATSGNYSGSVDITVENDPVSASILLADYSIFNMKVNIVDDKGNPIVGLGVYGTAAETTPFTNSYGEASFPVEYGTDSLTFKRGNYTTKQNITADGKTTNIKVDLGTVPGVTKEIPEDSVLWNGHRYYAFKAPGRITWFDAKQACEDLGGHLATMTSAEEDAIVWNLVKQQGVSDAWFGMYNMGTRSNIQMKWITNEPLEYTKWHRGEPNGNSRSASGSATGEFFVGYWEGDYWNDYVNDAAISVYVCEWEPTFASAKVADEAPQTKLTLLSLDSEDFSSYTNPETQVHTSNFTNLTFRKKYVMLVLKDDETGKKSIGERLVYIDTDIADSAGHITFSYKVPKDVAYTVFLYGDEEYDILEAKYFANDFEYTGQEFGQNLVLFHDNKLLAEGVDYTLSGDLTAKEIGEYHITVTGKGKYVGTSDITYYVKAKPAPETTKKVTVKKLSAPKLTAGKKKLVVKWTKTKSVTGYQIQYATNKKFTSAKKVTVKGASKVSKTIKSLKTGKTYYVRIRAYKKSGGKTYYGKWSTAKKVKVK